MAANCAELFGILEAESSRNGSKHALPVFEIARVLVRFDHVARFIVNANHRVIAVPPVGPSSIGTYRLSGSESWGWRRIMRTN